MITNTNTTETQTITNAPEAARQQAIQLALKKLHLAVTGDIRDADVIQRLVDELETLYTADELNAMYAAAGVERKDPANR